MRARRRLFCEQALQYEEHVGGALRQPAHKVRTPRRPPRHIYPQRVPFAEYLSLQVPPDTEQHLKFVFFSRHLLLCDFCNGIFDQGSVMRGHGNREAPGAPLLEYAVQ